MDPARADMGYLIGQTARWMRALLAEELRYHGLDDTAYIILYFVNDAGEGGVGTRALSNGIEMSFAELDTAARRLVRDGWLSESPDPEDDASRVVRLTTKAVGVLPMLADAAHWAIERGLNGFTSDEIEQLRDYLTRIQANLR